MHEAARGTSASSVGSRNEPEVLLPGRPSQGRPPQSSRAPADTASRTWARAWSKPRRSIKRPDFDAFFQSVANFQLLDRGDEPVQKPLVDSALHVSPVGRDAGLARVAEFGDDRALHGLVEIGVVEDQERSVAAQLQREFCDLPGGAGNQPLADLGRASEGNFAADGVFQQSRPRSRRNRPAPIGRRPGGSSASSTASANWTADSGVARAGLSITGQPAANAGAIFRTASTSGKFHGEIAPATPMGTRSTMCLLPRTWFGTTRP